MGGARSFGPHFFYIYLPHLDYAAQKFGPDSAAGHAALGELDARIGKLVGGVSTRPMATEQPLWLVASEYAIVPVDHVTYPNRVLREAGLLSVDRRRRRRSCSTSPNSRAWALVDHQSSHVFVRDPGRRRTRGELFRGQQGIAEVLVGKRARRRTIWTTSGAGEVVLISKPNSWQAYYWWLDDDRAPKFARTVDIHRKPGYDPVEMHLDMATKSTPLDATLVRGSHGAPPATSSQRGVLIIAAKRGCWSAPRWPTPTFASWCCGSSESDERSRIERTVEMFSPRAAGPGVFGPLQRVVS